MNKEEVFSAIKKLLATQHFAVLATQGDGFPYCTLVGYAQRDDIKEIYFATNRTTRKYNNLKNNPKVSLMIDSQTNRVDDIKDAQALTVLGDASEVNAASRKQAMACYLNKHPYLEDFVSASDCALIRIKVSKYILVQNFQNVLEYTIA